VPGALAPGITQVPLQRPETLWPSSGVCDSCSKLFSRVTPESLPRACEDTEGFTKAFKTPHFRQFNIQTMP